MMVAGTVEPAPAMMCVGYGGPCDRPGEFSGFSFGIDGRLCTRCRSRARRAQRDRDRPLGDCEAGCCRAAARRVRHDGRTHLVCERCADRVANQRAGVARSHVVRAVLPTPCASCGTTGGSPPSTGGDTPGRIMGDTWGIPGLICLDCAAEARLIGVDDDGPDAYLPTPDVIRRECEAIRAGWTVYERRQRVAPFYRNGRMRLPRLSGMEE